MDDLASLAELLKSLETSLSTGLSSLPETPTLVPPKDGISLLDVKNELFLSYLQSLVFLILLKARRLSSPDENLKPDSLDEEVTRMLVELRVYFDKGVRPLEGKLQYQIEKLLSTASDADSRTQPAQPKQSRRDACNDASGSDSEAEASAPPITDLSYRPNPSAFTLPASSTKTSNIEKPDGIYRPPRITPTVLPTTDRAAKGTSRPRKSATVEDFIREELTDAPLAEASIGAGRGLRGKEKEKDDERRAYEEQRLVRLPSEKGKKGRKRGPPGEDLDFGDLATGRLRGVEFGNLKASKKKKVEADGAGRRGKSWEQRVKQGLRRKRR